MDLTPRLIASVPATDPPAVWAACGGMALTGRRNGPPLPVAASVVDVLSGVAARLREGTARLGRPVDVDGPRLLGERAALMGLRRRGQESCGGAARLLRAADGWVGVSLARPDDVALVPAWLGVQPSSDDPWPAVAAGVSRCDADRLAVDAAELGLAAARLGEMAGEVGAVVTRAVSGLDGATGSREPPVTASSLRVVDLSSLWAGPLCGQLLQSCGMRVVKVESTQRADGARRGNSDFFDLLNAGKESVAVDFDDPAGVASLHALLEWADVVIEASRPRALEHLGIDAARVVVGGEPRVWLSITGHGRAEPHGRRVAFGDDAAVAGGLVAWDGDRPCFVADAAPDPAAGLLAATAVVDRLLAGGRWLVDVALSRTAALLASGETTVAWSGAVVSPTARRPAGRAAALGADTDSVLAELRRGERS